MKKAKKKIATALSTSLIALLGISYSNTALAQDNPSGHDNLKTNAENAQSGAESATSTANSAKDTSKSINDFFSSEDDPKGKELNPKQNSTGLQSREKPGNLFDRLFGRVTGVQIYTQKNANNNSSILSEIVIVYKPELYQQILDTKVKDWFTLSQANKNLRISNDLQIYRFETTPDLTYSEYLLDVNSSAVGAFLFTRTQNNLNSLPIKLNPYKNTRIKYFTFGFNFNQYPE
ncbi:hypothetical protein QEJ31_11835 [Pigmentibacter sp. JX0631]|uniref:hypothetical protein n=1 Tax=Pigmentibacter sp. JX0631 TaxID=2976982 RepID=UPI0024688F4A|nr:hypothetical protein [Pigmentibacter sp. JX0631]WGL59212.1 hypothetical protein QEJ31_11835 [Pigmentibacter sp. JX0631]